MGSPRHARKVVVKSVGKAYSANRQKGLGSPENPLRQVLKAFEVRKTVPAREEALCAPSDLCQKLS